MGKSRNNFDNEEEHDKTLSMLDYLRGDTKSSSINEDAAEPLEQPPEENGDEPESQMGAVKDEPSEEEAIEPPSEELRNEKEQFRQNVDSRVEFEAFKIYPKSRNVVFAGQLQGFGGLYWYFSLDEREGVYISADNLQLTDEAMETLSGLMGYYKNWAKEWAQKVVDEYSSDNEEDEEEV